MNIVQSTHTYNKECSA